MRRTAYLLAALWLFGCSNPAPVKRTPQAKAARTSAKLISDRIASKRQAMLRKPATAQKRAEMEPDPQLLAVLPARQYWLVFSNSNPTAQTWVIESRRRMTDPWSQLAEGSVNRFSEATNQIWPTQAVAFYRVGFKWP